MAANKSLLKAIVAILSWSASSVVWAVGAQLNMTPGVTEVSQSVYELHQIVLWICVAIGIAVFAAMLYSIIYHRKSKHPKPADFHESTFVEIIWTVIPAVILVIMAVPATKTLLAMEDSSEADMTVKVTGYQWKWHYEYMNEEGLQGFFSNLSTPKEQIEEWSQVGAPKGEHYLLEVDNPLVLPIGKKVRFLVTANDVIHSWWVPSFAVKKDAIPGFVNEAWTKIDKPGVYRGQCAELCGKDHGFMPIVVVAKTEADYQKWIAEQKAEQAEAARQAAIANAKTFDLATLMKEGEAVYNAKCAACHQVSGAGMPPAFPALKGSPMATQASGLADHIDIVLNGKAGSAMQAFAAQLTDLELAAVITYERNAWGNDTGDVVQPADIVAKR